ncbi:MAG: DUF6323 family protein [Oscillospiraceae bacterium]
MHSNEASAQYGLLLTREQAGLLLQARREALRKCGRIEFGSGVIDKLADAFCDSPYLSPGCYVQALQKLQELFYTYKNETLDLISDDELIEQMAYYFNTSCEGSFALLESRELDRLAHDCDLAPDGLQATKNSPATRLTRRRNSMYKPAIPHQADAKNLPEDAYFRLLLREAEQGGLLSVSALSNIQAQLASLLAERAQRFTGFENSSLRTETAERLLQSVCYTLGVALKGQPDIAGGIALLEKTPLQELFDTGQTYLSRRVSAAWRLYKKVLQTRIPTSLLAYNDTLDGIRAFFSSYDPERFAQDAGGSIDYPLLLACPETGGVTFLYEYLRRLLLENRFCACFPPEAVVSVLRAHSPSYRELLLNISRHVLQNALGCVLAGRDVRALRLTDADRKTIAARLRPLSASGTARLLQRAARSVCGALPHAGEALLCYISGAARALAPHIAHALETDALALLFVTPVAADAEASVLPARPRWTRRVSPAGRRAAQLPPHRISSADPKQVHSASDLLDLLGAAACSAAICGAFLFLQKSSLHGWPADFPTQTTRCTIQRKKPTGTQPSASF